MHVHVHVCTLDYGESVHSTWLYSDTHTHTRTRTRTLSAHRNQIRRVPRVLTDNRNEQSRARVRSLLFPRRSEEQEHRVLDGRSQGCNDRYVEH